EINGNLNTFYRGTDGLLHNAIDFTNDIAINSSPQIDLPAPAVAYDPVTDAIYAAVVTPTGELKVGAGKSQRQGFKFARVWSWADVGRTVSGADIAIGCGKVVVAWLDGDHIRTSFRNLNSDTWSSPFDAGEGTCVPSLATTPVSAYGDFGITFLRSNGSICFRRAQCSSDLEWGAIENPVGIAKGNRVGIAAYGEYFALATMGGDNHPYFSMQVDGANGLPVWPGFEPVKAVSFEEPKIIEAPELTIFRGMIFATARNISNELLTWLRLPNHLGIQSGIGWCGGRIVGAAGNFAAAPVLVPIGQEDIYELQNVPAELFIVAAGLSTNQLFALNFSRSVSLDLLESFFRVNLVPNAGNDLEMKWVGNLPEHVMALIALPDEAWRGVTGKKCDNNLNVATTVHLNPATAGQARPGQCPMEMFLNGGKQSARFMLHEWMHVDFSQRKIGSWPGFDAAFGDPKPRLCGEGKGCAGDECLWADGFTQAFDDANIIRWAGKKVCVDNGRPQGGVDFYELESAEHAFIETATRYRFQGDELRSLASRDKQRGNDQLQRRYDWIKASYYKGQEFNGWYSSGYTSNPGIAAGDRTRGYIGRPFK
ncbi:MAG TPA: hypothetical protein VK498_05070, partial [Ferruginibacter sp.]|nr:hypothetical protein [Ferruginibacter sp.]